MPSTLAASETTTHVNGNGSHGRQTNRRRNGKVPKEESNSSDQDNVPLGTRAIVSKPSAKRKHTKKKAKVEDDVWSEDDTPLAPPKKDKAKPKVVKGKAKAKIKEQSAEDIDMDGGDNTPKKKSKSKSKASAKMAKEDNGEGKASKKEDEEEVFRWWDTPADVEGDGSVKWKTLEHNGVLFPPPYQLLPKDVKMKYNGVSHLLHMVRYLRQYPQVSSWTCLPKRKKSQGFSAPCWARNTPRTRPLGRIFSTISSLSSGIFLP